MFTINNSFPQKTCCYWDNVDKYDGPRQARDDIIWCMHNAWWIPTAINTHSKYVILNAFPLQLWFHECVSFLRLYVHCLINPLNAQLNPIYHLLALLLAHPILHIGRIRVKAYIFNLSCAVFEISAALTISIQLFRAVYAQWYCYWFLISQRNIQPSSWKV